MQKLVSVVGTTASGKSDLGIVLANKFNGEIVSCDSRQVFKGLDLGTGKVTKEEMLEKFDEATVERMCAEAAERRARIEWLYNVEQTISL